MIKSLLTAAHKSSDPLGMLENLLIEHPTKAMVDILVPSTLDLSKAEECDVMTDICAYREQGEQDSFSDIAWRCKFLYFATSMCHIFGEGDFYPDPNAHVITYIEPNVPKPYIWLDLDDKRHVQLVQRYNVDEDSFRVLVHCISGVNELDTQVYEIGPAKIRGSEALQLCLRLDLLGKNAEGSLPHSSPARLTRPHPSIDCIVLLTFKKKFSGIYYKTKHPLIANTITKPANKS